jgi:hypothetical protein
MKLISNKFRLCIIKPTKIETDPEELLYLLQLFYLITHPIANKFRFVYTPKKGTREVIKTENYTDLAMSIMTTLSKQVFGLGLYSSFEGYLRDDYTIQGDIQALIKKLTDK